MFEALWDRSRSAFAASELYLPLPEQRLAALALEKTLLRPADDSCGDWITLYGPPSVGKSIVCRSMIRRCSVAGELPCLSTTFAELMNVARLARARDAMDRLTSELTGLRAIVCHRVDLSDSNDAADAVLDAGFWDALIDAGLSIIWTSRVMPGAIPHLSSKLVSRAHGGACVPMTPLTDESRLLLFDAWAADRSLFLSTEVRQVLATFPAHELQQIRFWMDRWPAGTSIGLAELESLRHAPTLDTPTFEEIAVAVAEQFQLSLDDLRSRSRSRANLLPRHCAIFLSRELSNASLESIGAYFGGRDHSTISHACSQFETLVSKQPQLKVLLQHLRVRLTRSRREECA